jgi:hypothetical protein
MGRSRRGGFRFSPQVTADLDQRIAAVAENLDRAIGVHRDNRRGAGDESVAIARTVGLLSVFVMGRGQQGVTNLVDMFTLALSRLADAPDVAAIVEELRRQAETHTAVAANCRTDLLAVSNEAEARAYREAIRIIKAAE